MKKKIGDYILEKEIGSGAYGKVFRAINPGASSQLFAVKMTDKINITEKIYRYLEREVEILQMLENEHIVQLKDIKATENHYYLIFEYCNGGDLSEYRKSKGGKISEKNVRFIFPQIVDGLNALYTKKAIHRDLKLSNILLTYPTPAEQEQDKPKIKLGDFGFARVIQQNSASLEISTSEDFQPMSFVGTPLYMAPELFMKKEYSFKADIWSLGICLYELLCGKNCFTGVTKEELSLNIAKGIYKIDKELNLSCECLDFLNNCLQTDSKKRANWKMLREHDFIKAEKFTIFNMDFFKELNPEQKKFCEDEKHLILSTRVKYSFFKPDLCENKSENVPENNSSQEKQENSSPEEKLESKENDMPETKIANSDDFKEIIDITHDLIEKIEIKNNADLPKENPEKIPQLLENKPKNDTQPEIKTATENTNKNQENDEKISENFDKLENSSDKKKSKENSDDLILIEDENSEFIKIDPKKPKNTDFTVTKITNLNIEDQYFS